MDKQRIQLSYEKLGQDWQWISLFIDFSNGFTFKKDAMIIAEAHGEIEKRETQLGVMWRPASLSDAVDTKQNKPHDDAPHVTNLETQAHTLAAQWAQPDPDAESTPEHELKIAYDSYYKGYTVGAYRIAELEAEKEKMRGDLYKISIDHEAELLERQRLEALNGKYTEALEEIKSSTWDNLVNFGRTSTQMLNRAIEIAKQALKGEDAPVLCDHKNSVWNTGATLLCRDCGKTWIDETGKEVERTVDKGKPQSAQDLIDSGALD